MNSAKRRSTTMDEQTFVPETMRALYWCPASTAIRDSSSLDEPRVDSEVVLDTDFPTPKPSPCQYLIHVQTAAFSHDELQLANALHPTKSIPQIPVHNFCGTVISTPTRDHEKPDGPTFKVDETVFGHISFSQDGAAADYVLATEDQIAHKPKNISAAEAATIPLPALTAWQALFKYAGLDPREGNSHSRRNLRILITNALSSEVGTQALHLLRSPDLFPHSRAWICATCASKDAEEILRKKCEVDETLLIPQSETKNFDLSSIFRANKWDPVDAVIDCTGEGLHQPNSSTIMKDGGAVLTAVDANPVVSVNPKEKDGGGPSTRVVSVEPDGKALGLIAKMVEGDLVRGRAETIVDLVDGVDLLASDAAAASGGWSSGVIVLRVNP